MNKAFAMKYIDDLLSDYCMSICKFRYELVDNSVYFSFAHPHIGFKPYVQIAVSDDFLNPNVNCVKEYDFVETVIALHHECYHLQQYKSDTNSNMFLDLESYVSKCSNDGIYYAEYDKFLHEIAAERYALHMTYTTLKSMFDTDIDAILLDYVNARMCTDGAPFYFIKSDERIRDMQTVFDLFDDAYESAKEFKKSFVDYKDDCVGRILAKDAILANGFNKAIDGLEQTHFAATLVLNEYPGLYKELRGLKKSDYDIQEIIDAGNRRELRSFIRESSFIRELPAIDDLEQDDMQFGDI